MNDTVSDGAVTHFSQTVVQGHHVRKETLKGPSSLNVNRRQSRHGRLNKKQVRSVTALTALTLCRGGTVPVCRRFARSANSNVSPFSEYIPVRSNVNNGSECAPLNFVMASAAFRLCGHHRGRHIALRMNSSMIFTSRADFRSS